MCQTLLNLTLYCYRYSKTYITERETMSKIAKEFKQDVDKEVREGTYIVRKVGSKILIAIAVLSILGGIGGVGYTLTIGKWQKNAEKEVFKSSTAYTEQAASFLAKSYKEYNEAESDTEKNTIMEYVILRYPNLDTDSIDNSTLKQFYIKCLNN